MLIGAYPFEDPDGPKNFRKTLTVSTPDLCLFMKKSSPLIIRTMTYNLLVPFAEDTECTVLDSRLCSNFNGMQTSAVPDICQQVVLF
jgi:hypothetical protein